MRPVWSSWSVGGPAKKNKRPVIGFSGLTERQKQVAVLIAAGKSCKQIARELDIHFQTVMKHRENLYRRLGIKNALSLALLVSGGHMG